MYQYFNLTTLQRKHYSKIKDIVKEGWLKFAAIGTIKVITMMIILIISVHNYYYSITRTRRTRTTKPLTAVVLDRMKKILTIINKCKV